MACRWGYIGSSPHLWGKHGFPSKRLPASSALVVARRLQGAAEGDSLNSTEWKGRADQTFQAQLLSNKPATLWQSQKRMSYRRVQELQQMSLLLQQQQQQQLESEPVIHSHLAHALVALTVILLPLAGGLLAAQGCLSGRQGIDWLRHCTRNARACTDNLAQCTVSWFHTLHCWVDQRPCQ